MINKIIKMDKDILNPVEVIIVVEKVTYIPSVTSDDIFLLG